MSGYADLSTRKGVNEMPYDVNDPQVFMRMFESVIGRLSSKVQTTKYLDEHGHPAVDNDEHELKLTEIVKGDAPDW